MTTTHPQPAPGFADDPVAPHSAQFGLARPVGTAPGDDQPSPAGTRPWNLRSAAALPPSGPWLSGWRYDHAAQIAVTADGIPLARAMGGEPTSTSVSQLDGDEGPSEDWSHDFCPEQPGSPW